MSEVEPKLEMTRLGSYTIVRKLAKGGMAEIFLARSSGPEGFEKLVVLKKILPKYAENQRFVQLFLDEAKLAASLDHPHIVQVYDMGRVDGNYFFTMEYVHGQDVRSILRKASRSKHPLPIAIAVQIARTMAAALHHAHERRRPDGTPREVVHRDVSPSNILVSYDGAIKLADFGVAKAASSTVRTRTGALKGKVGYMSPEQARGASIDRRSDIFSLGVVLWELVSMRRLFKSDNDLATIQAIINTPPPPLTDFRADCPPELDRIARRALEKDPAVRYQSAQQIQHDLEELARELKLDQSSIALSHFMTELFDTEIAAWRDAQSTGVTVTDFVLAYSEPNGATPVSESDLSLDDPDEEDEDSDPEVDAEQSEPTALPPQQPRSGVISRDDGDDATDFGPPPTMESIAQLVTSPVAASPRPLASTVPRVKPPIVPARDTEREENPFDMATTRLRPNPMIPGESSLFNDNMPTSVAAPIFTEEAPTVQAPADILARAFAETAETVVSSPRFTDADSAAFLPGDISTLPFPKKEMKTTAFAKPRTPDTTEYPMQSPSVYVTAQTPPVGVPETHGVPAKPIATPGSGVRTPMPNPSGHAPGALSMPTLLGGPGSNNPGGPSMSGSGSNHPMHGQNMSGTGSMPNMPMHGYPNQAHTPMGGVPATPHGYPGAPSDLNIDLAPQRRWFIIAGVAVGLAVLMILLVVLLSRGPVVEDTTPDPKDEPITPRAGVTPAKDNGSATAKPAPSANPANGSAAKAAGSGSAKAAAGSGSESGSGSAETKTEIATPTPTNGSATTPKPLPRITKQPPLRRPQPKRR